VLAGRDAQRGRGPRLGDRDLDGVGLAAVCPGKGKEVAAGVGDGDRHGHAEVSRLPERGFEHGESAGAGKAQARLHVAFAQGRYFFQNCQKGFLDCDWPPPIIMP
jgi:hypothetical protein